MHEYLKPLPLVAIILGVVTLTSLESRSGVSKPQPALSCEAASRSLRENVLKSWGYGSMVAQMKRISHELKPEERKDLKRLTETIDASGANPTLQAHSVRMIKSIYAEAIERSGLSRGIPEVNGEIQRAITANPTGSDPLLDGHTVVLGSAPHKLDKKPSVGDITNAFLGVSADQTHYELILVRASRVAPSVHDGYETEGDYISLQQYLKDKTPARCSTLSSR